MVNRKGIRCGPQGCRYFSGHWRAKKFQAAFLKAAFRQARNAAFVFEGGRNGSGPAALFSFGVDSQSSVPERKPFCFSCSPGARRSTKTRRNCSKSGSKGANSCVGCGGGFV